MHRDRIVGFLRDRLDRDRMSDASLNGLQVEGKEEVRKIVFGVSASLELFRLAAARGADMIVVHHGLFWGGHPYTVTGGLRKKLDLLLSKGISLVAWHLPLDRHPSDGNNARILRLLGARGQRPFGMDNGNAIGVRGTFARPRTIPWIESVLERELSSRPLSFPFGPKAVRTIGIISGGAARMFEQAVAEGLDLFLTGEASEFVQEYARENRTSFIAGGHYNTEKPGAQALAGLLRAKFGLRTEFIDVPNPV